MTATATTSVRTSIGYAPAETVVADDERVGLLRSPTLDRSTAYDDGGVAFETCTIRNIDAADEAPGFVEAGFEAVRLPERPELLALLGEIREAGVAGGEQVERLRSLLTGTVIELADGSRLRIDHVADEGVIVRQAGPDRMEVEDAEHHGAVNVHIDQDVQGTPLRQLFDGGAADVFAHDSPDSSNKTSTQHLVNAWLPLQQITRPLTLMDGRSLDRRRHQLRYRLPVDGFLDREEEQSVNDIWLCLHDPAQEWWFRPEAALGDAYVFDTLSTAHASIVLPGEEIAADRYRRIGEVVEAVEDGDLDQAHELASFTPAVLDTDASATLSAAVAAMDALLTEARAAIDADGDLDQAWRSKADAARNGVVRKSLELRAVATRLPPAS